MGDSPAVVSVVECEAFREQAANFSEAHNLPLVKTCPEDAGVLCIYFTKTGLEVGGWTDQHQRWRFAPGFHTPQFLRRLKTVRAKDLLLRAVGAAKQPTVWDLTAGWGRDAFTLASFGCRVVAFERNALICSIVQQNLEGLRMDSELGMAAERFQLYNRDSAELLAAPAISQKFPPPDVLYMDPMFTSTEKSALPKKEMQVFRWLLAGASDQERLFHAAKSFGCRLVVKRNIKAPSLGAAPRQTLAGRRIRYDIYFPSRRGGPSC